MRLDAIPDIEFVEAPAPLRDPVMLAGIDMPGNTGAVAALHHLVDAFRPRLLGEIDPDEYYDFTVSRPFARLVEGDRVIEWGPARLYHLPLPERDLVLLVGGEPHFRWRRFARLATATARAYGVRDVVLVSTYAGATPHTRPVPLRWLPMAGAQASRFGIPGSTPRYQGPATFAMALGVAFREAGFQVGALSAIMPLYVGVDPNPYATRALLEALAAEFGLAPDLDKLDTQIGEVARAIERQYAATPTLATFVENLEEQWDAGFGAQVAETSEPLLPEASDVIASIEGLLRDDRNRGGASSKGRMR